MSQPANERRDLKSRLTAEFKSYAVISAYLFVCFGVILLYEASLSSERQHGLAAFGLAVGKALVIGKFILIGEALSLGTRVSAPTLLHRIAWRTGLFLLLLIVLEVLEELVMGLVHGHGMEAILSELAERPWLSVVAPVLVMLLILIPLVTATEIQRALGKGKLKALLLGSDGDDAAR